jgi:preprotein translocase YajC subunit
LLDSTTDSGNSIMSYILLPLVLVVLVGGFIWSSYSAKKRQKSTMDMINKLTAGDKIKTIGGICGVIVEINEEENTFILETGNDTNKSYVKFDKQAIYQTEPKAVETTEIEENIEDAVTNEVSNEDTKK